MNRSKRLGVLLGVLAAVCLLIFVLSRYQQRQEDIQTSGETVLEIPVDSVQAVSWENETQSLAFHKDESWVYDEDEAFPVDGEKLEEMLDLFSQFGAAFIIESPEDLGQYGLDDPVCTIQIETEEGTTEILLGDYSTMDSQRYVSIGDGNVYLVTQDPLDTFDAELKDVILNDEVPQFEEVSQIDFSGSEEENYQIQKQEDNTADTYREEDIYFTQQDGQNQPLDTDKVEDYLDTLSALGLTDYLSYNATEEEIADCGLDDPDLTVQVAYTGQDEEGESFEDTFVLHISRDPEEKARAESEEEAESSSQDEEEEEEITAYARVGDSQILYHLDSDSYQALMESSFDDLRHSQVLPADLDQIRQVDIQLEDESYTITAQGEGEDRTYQYGEEELESEDFPDALEALSADTFTDEEPGEKLEIGLTLYLEGEEDTRIQVNLYRYDGSDCLAVVDGEPLCLVKRSSVMDLVEAVNAIVLN